MWPEAVIVLFCWFVAFFLFFSWVFSLHRCELGLRWRSGQVLGHASEILGGGSKQKFIAGAVRSAQSKSIELQDSLEVSE